MRLISTGASARLALPCLLLTAACSSSSDSPATTAPTADLAQVITMVQADGLAATVAALTGAPPAGVPTGVALTFQGAGTVAQGSTAQTQLSATEAFDAIIVRLQGVDGYYQIDLAQPQTVVDLLLSLSGSAPAGFVDCIYQGRRAGETEFGAPVVAPVEVLNVGSGELQINLTWTTDADLDLHVFEPDGTQIAYFNTLSASGGQLDLDANVGCGNVGVENIFWNQNPPLGEYRVAVDNFTDCAQTSSDFVVTVSLPGEAPQVFTGAVTEADGLLDVTTFTISN